jgi:hypothetical protein
MVINWDIINLKKLEFTQGCLIKQVIDIGKLYHHTQLLKSMRIPSTEDIIKKNTAGLHTLQGLHLTLFHTLQLKAVVHMISSCRRQVAYMNGLESWSKYVPIATWRIYNSTWQKHLINYSIYGNVVSYFKPPQHLWRTNWISNPRKQIFKAVYTGMTAGPQRFSNVFHIITYST